MKMIICISLVFAALGWADEGTDRAAIGGVIGALNANQTGADQERIARLFTTDADNELDRLANLDRRLLQPSDKPWSEVTTPRIVIQSIRFITAGVALVDAANTQYGSTIVVRRAPVLFVMKKQAGDWRIASLRVLVNLLSLP
jgi:hypothetical protein